jgi:hypothetical protein
MKIQDRECSNQGETLGMGFDSLRNIHLPNSAIEISGETEKEIFLAQQSPVEEKYRFEHIKNESELSSSFSISAKIGAEIGGVASGLGIPSILSASAKADFFSGVQIKQESLYILLDYQLKNDTYRILNPRLSNEAEILLKDQSGPDKFRKKYGDEFIIGFKTGVDYTAIIEVMNLDSNNREKSYLEILAEISNVLSDLLSLPLKDIGGTIDSNRSEILKKYASKALCLKRPPNISDSGISLTLDKLIPDFANFKKEVVNSREKQHLKYTALFADYDQLLAVQHDILSPGLKRLKLKLNRLRSIKLQKQTLMLSFQNQLRFQGQNFALQDTVSKLGKLSEDIYELEDYIGECLYLPESMSKERYEYFLNPKFQYRFLQ